MSEWKGPVLYGDELDNSHSGVLPSPFSSASSWFLSPPAKWCGQPSPIHHTCRSDTKAQLDGSNQTCCHVESRTGFYPPWRTPDTQQVGDSLKESTSCRKSPSHWPNVPAVVMDQVELFSVVHICLLDVCLINLLSFSSAVLHPDLCSSQRVFILFLLAPKTAKQEKPNKSQMCGIKLSFILMQMLSDLFSPNYWRSKSFDNQPTSNWTALVCFTNGNLQILLLNASLWIIGQI